MQTSSVLTATVVQEALSGSVAGRGIVERKIDGTTYVINCFGKQITVDTGQVALVPGETVTVSTQGDTIQIMRSACRPRQCPADTVHLASVQPAPDTTDTGSMQPLPPSAGILSENSFNQETFLALGTPRQALSFLIAHGVEPAAAKNMTDALPAADEVFARIVPTDTGAIRIVLLSAVELEAELRVFLDYELTTSPLRQIDPALIREVVQRTARLDLQTILATEALVQSVPLGLMRNESITEGSFSHWVQLVFGNAVQPGLLPACEPVPDTSLMAMITERLFSVHPETRPVHSALETLTLERGSATLLPRSEQIPWLLERLGVNLERLISTQRLPFDTPSLKEQLSKFAGTSPVAALSVGQDTPSTVPHQAVRELEHVLRWCGHCTEVLSDASVQLSSKTRHQLSDELFMVRLAGFIALTRLEHPELNASPHTQSTLPAAGSDTPPDPLPALPPVELVGVMEKSAQRLLSILTNEGVEPDLLKNGVEKLVLHTHTLRQALSSFVAPGESPEDRQESFSGMLNILRTIAGRLLDRLDAIQILSRPVAVSGEGEQHIWAIPLRMEGEWTEVKIHLTKKRSPRRGGSRGRGFSAVLAVAPPSVGAVEARFEYRPPKAMALSMRFARDSVREWFEQQRDALAGALTALGITPASIDFGSLQNKRASRDNSRDEVVDGKVDMRV